MYFFFVRSSYILKKTVNYCFHNSDSEPLCGCSGKDVNVSPVHLTGFTRNHKRFHYIFLLVNKTTEYYSGHHNFKTPFGTF